MSNDVIIDVQCVSKCYQIYNTPRDRLKQLILPHTQKIANALGKPLRRTSIKERAYFKEYWALKDISFQVRRGETFGIIGRNGSGKSTLLQMIAGTLLPTNGNITVKGRVAALLELGSGFNPEYTGRENVFFNGYILGLTKQEILERYDQIVEFADIGEFIDQPVKTYSSGMFVRLAFAVQAHVDASIVIIDEALAVGDIFFRQKCYARLEKLKSTGAAILLVSHSMTEVEEHCEKALLLDRGHEHFIGKSVEAARHYYFLHQPQVNNSYHSDSINSILPVHHSPTNICLGNVKCPSETALIDVSRMPQVSDSLTRCISIAICNEKGEPCHYFTQGETAFFYYVFELDKAIEIPSCGIIIKNDQGILVHGKNSFQFDSDMPSVLDERSRIYCRQEINLALSPGEYSIEAGLASVPINDWTNRHHIAYEELLARLTVICCAPNIAYFSVGPIKKNGVTSLTHHGLVNLEGDITVAMQVLPSNEELSLPVD